VSKYIKWELKDYFSKKLLFFIGIGAIFLLSSIIPYNTDFFLGGLIHFGFFMIVFVSLGFSFVIGTKRITDTFTKKTFLLESMIPLSVKKILLSKFIIGFLINFIYSVIGIIGLLIILVKGGDINILDVFDGLFKTFNTEYFIRFCMAYIISILAFMSTVMLCYIIGKVIKPNGKGNKLIAIIIWFILFYSISYVAAIIAVDTEPDLILDLIYAITTVASFFVSSWLIENKLEIYN